MKEYAIILKKFVKVIIIYVIMWTLKHLENFKIHILGITTVTECIF